MFSNILLKIGEKTLQSIDNEYIAVLEGIFVVLFNSLNERSLLAQKTSTLESAINAAIKLEKDSLLLYYSMNNAIENNGKGKISEIIKEEQFHLHRV